VTGETVFARARARDSPCFVRPYIITGPCTTYVLSINELSRPTDTDAKGTKFIAPPPRHFAIFHSSRSRYREIGEEDRDVRDDASFDVSAELKGESGYIFASERLICISIGRARGLRVREPDLNNAVMSAFRSQTQRSPLRGRHDYRFKRRRLRRACRAKKMIGDAMKIA